jgi:DNA-binding MarR family transcriptional regulator
MGASNSHGKSELAAEVWRLMSEFSFSAFREGRHVAMLREMGLTPGHMKALSLLDPTEPKPMRAMADSLACDASMITWLVDRLEERGLVERGASPTDRRVKTVVLTPLGIRTRKKLLAALEAPPADLLYLDASSLRTLRDQLRKLPGAGRSDPKAPRSSTEIGSGAESAAAV